MVGREYERNLPLYEHCLVLVLEGREEACAADQLLESLSISLPETREQELFDETDHMHSLRPRSPGELTLTLNRTVILPLCDVLHDAVLNEAGLPGVCAAENIQGRILGCVPDVDELIPPFDGHVAPIVERLLETEAVAFQDGYLAEKNVVAQFCQRSGQGISGAQVGIVAAHWCRLILNNVVVVVPAVICSRGKWKGKKSFVRDKVKSAK